MSNKGITLIIVLIVWVVAVGMIQSHNAGAKVVGYIVALGCAYAFFKIVIPKDKIEK